MTCFKLSLESTFVPCAGCGHRLLQAYVAPLACLGCPRFTLKLIGLKTVLPDLCEAGFPLLRAKPDLRRPRLNWQPLA
jgi:hypothetical protein